VPLTPAIYAARRQALMNQIGTDSIIIIPSAMAKQRNGDVDHLFRQDSSFYYLTGFSEPNAVAILIPNADGGKYILFNRAHDPDMDVWVGAYAGQEGAVSEFGANESFDIETLEQKLFDIVKPFTKIYYPLGGCYDFYPKESGPNLEDILNKLFRKRRADLLSRRAETFSLHDPSEYIHKMRLIKEPVELELMQKAIDISLQGHLRTMQSDASEKRNEMTLSAQFISEIMHHNTQEVAYPNVVGAGKHSCTLHYEKNDSAISDGDIVLMDSGAEYQNYASDITRSFPINGKFTLTQRAIYDVVLQTQDACIAATKPGVTLKEIHELSIREITKGLITLGILAGDLETLIKNDACSPYYMHGVGHWLGLDLHDTSIVKSTTPFQAGMVFTIEPGIYISHPETLDPKWHNIGVRIEDDILVTEEGCKVLSEALPRKADDIERMMAGWVPPGIAKLGFQRYGLFSLEAEAKEDVKEPQKVLQHSM
jgi:Xaa-Pro aminopeptidase